MKEITKDLLKDCAHRLMFDMTEEQYEVLENEFAIVLKQMELIGAEKMLMNIAR